MYRRQLIRMSLAFVAVRGIPLVTPAIAKETTGSPTPMSLDECIATCLSCHRTCIETVSEAAGDKTLIQPATLIALMMDCAEVCLATAHSMSRRSPIHTDLCEICAKLCDKCASACEALVSHEYLALCARACRDCAASCRHMAAMR